MRKIIAVVNVSLLALAVGVVTAAAAPPARASSTPATKSASSAAPKAAKPAAPATHSVSGTIESFDASAKTLTVKGAKSTWTFNASSAQAWEGSKSIGVDELSSHTGAKVTVKYTDHDGEKSASSVRLAAAHAAKAPAKSK
jgi:phage baseplate assembly protein gpV